MSALYDSQAIGMVTSAELVRAWLAKDRVRDHMTIEQYRVLAGRLLKLGELLLAHDVCHEGLGMDESPQTLTGKDADLRQSYALALARCGLTLRAQRVIQELCDEGHRDEESLGILARTYKDLWLREKDPQRKGLALTACIARYEEVWRSLGKYWTGINVATLSLVAGGREKAAATARSVLQCAEADAAGKDYWAKATMGEACLVLGDRAGASRWYGEAAALAAASGNWGDIAASRKQANLLLVDNPADAAWIDRVLPVPAVGVFTGHMIDADDRLDQRFPSSAQGVVAERIKRYIVDNNIGIGYASAACGADILFLEAMQDLGRETHMVLPAAEEDFVACSVRQGAGGGWEDRFYKVRQRATVTVVGDDARSPAAYIYGNLILLGLARGKARQLANAVTALAVWDGNPGLPGGTGSAVVDWRKQGACVDLIHSRTGEYAAGLAGGSTDASAAPGALTFNGGAADYAQRIVSMVFADIKGFSRLRDAQITPFVRRYLGAVAALVDKCVEVPLYRNTWGDGLFFCFASPWAAADCALRLCELTGGTDWEAEGLQPLGIRVALHCGPAFEVMDPVTRQRNYFGSEVSRAARIEPVTPVNCVYASQPFAAIVECLGVPDMACDYVGTLPLAKDYGAFPMYLVQRR